MRSKVCWVALLALLLGLVGAVPAAADASPADVPAISADLERVRGLA